MFCFARDGILMLLLPIIRNTSIHPIVAYTRRSKPSPIPDNDTDVSTRSESTVDDQSKVVSRDGDVVSNANIVPLYDVRIKIRSVNESKPAPSENTPVDLDTVGDARSTVASSNPANDGQDASLNMHQTPAVVSLALSVLPPRLRSAVTEAGAAQLSWLYPHPNQQQQQQQQNRSLPDGISTTTTTPTTTVPHTNSAVSADNAGLSINEIKQRLSPLFLRQSSVTGNLNQSLLTSLSQSIPSSVGSRHDANTNSVLVSKAEMQKRKRDRIAAKLDAIRRST